ncbi:MAG: outer membrane lipid asymmetry maintenance protein MlaD [Pseudomonadota bacterium]
MNQNIIETMIGFIVLGIALTFFVFAYTTGGNTNSHKGYTLKANFQSAEGIVPGSDIMVAGIKIGSVTKLTLNRDTFFAMMEMSINDDIKLPTDSQAAIVSSGFLGGKFVSIVPGGDSEDLKHNDQIKLTQSSVNMESLIGKFMYSYGSSKH